MLVNKCLGFIGWWVVIFVSAFLVQVVWEMIPEKQQYGLQGNEIETGSQYKMCYLMD